MKDLPTITYEQVKDILKMTQGSVTGGTAKTWTYTPTMTVTVSARQGARIAFRLLWDSLVAAWHREGVTFEVGDDA